MCKQKHYAISRQTLSLRVFKRIQSSNMLRCLVLAIFIFPTFLLSANTLVVAISDFPPAIDLSDENYGTHGALVIDALKKTKQPFEIKIFSWTRIKKMLDTEEICSFGWVKNKERQKLWQYSHPYNADISYLWGRKDNKLKLLSLDDALQHRIGVTRGFSYGQHFDELLNSIETDESFDDASNLRKLIAGRIDLFPGQAIIIEPILVSQFSEQAHELETKIEINNLKHHFVCNAQSQLGKETIQKLNPFLPKI